MKRLLLSLALLWTAALPAQVTIGSPAKPAPGALLDLKQDGTTEKGMMLPRVKLAAFEQLTLGNNAIPNANQAWEQHAGLTVYNVSGEPIPKCAPIPDGLYVWDGGKWNGINVNKVDPATLTLSGADINFPSGLDLRPMPTVETFTAIWTPTDKPVTYTNTPHATWTGISFNGANTPPASGNLTISPTAFSLLPDAMTPAEITANPFRTKQNTLTFKVANECGTEITEIRVVNQTNKALTVQTPFKEATANSSETNGIKSNAQWKLKSIVPNDNTNALFNASGVNTLKIDGTLLTTASPAQGEEKSDNTSKDGTLTYDITVGATKARYSILTFEDAAATKRFSDVTVTVLQCTNVGPNPTIEQWAITAGFTQGEIDAVKSTGTDSRKLSTGIQMHRVKDTPRGMNQIFLSSNFGTNPQDDDQRWMIHNLDSKAYDGVEHSVPSRPALSGPNGNTGSPSNTAYWAYPKPAGAIAANNDAAERPTYDNNQRLGLLYSWDAATAGKGGADGRGNVDNTGALQESGRREGYAGTEQKRRQGICPSGWHLPSDDEWSLLEQDLVNNKATFSSLATSTGATLNAELSNPTYGVIRTDAGVVGLEDWRGLADNPNGHGNAMKETCEPRESLSMGASNGINNYARPGFDTLLAGFAGNSQNAGFGATAYYISSSSAAGAMGWYRYMNTQHSSVKRQPILRAHAFSVRCKR